MAAVHPIQFVPYRYAELRAAGLWGRHGDMLSAVIVTASSPRRLALALVNRYANDDHINGVGLRPPPAGYPGRAGEATSRPDPIHVEAARWWARAALNTGWRRRAGQGGRG